MATIYGFEKAKQALEYDKIIDFISSKCVSETGRNRLSNSQPLTDPVTLNKILIQIGEMREIYLADGGLPIWEFEDIRLFLNRIEPAESYLEIADCLKIQSFLEIVADISAFFIKLKDKYPELTQIVGRLAEKKTLLNQLKFTIDPSGQIYDNASNELKTIRKAIHQLQNEVHIRLQRIIRKNFGISTGRIYYPKGGPACPTRERVFGIKNQRNCPWAVRFRSHIFCGTHGSG